MIRRAAWGIAFTLAIGAALAPLPSGTIERWYSRGAYLSIERALATTSNLVPFALFDALWGCAVVVFAVAAYRAIAGLGWMRGAGRVAVTLARTAAVAYLAFLTLWGLNYRRVPLTLKLSFDPARVTREAAARLAARTVVALNRTYAAAHARPTTLSALAASFHDTERSLGAPRTIVPGRPKQTLLGGYFHHAAVSGMTDPFFLETLIAPDLLEVERPFVIAHEWGHLAGYAAESEASFVGWLTCLRADESAQYSAWLALFEILQSHVSRDVARQLDGGPKSDLYAMRYRYVRTSPLVRAAARETYDRYLKANRVEQGIASYDEVVQLILGTQVGADGRPRVR
jgi:hypothetical protein